MNKYSVAQVVLITSSVQQPLVPYYGYLISEYTRIDLCRWSNCVLILLGQKVSCIVKVKQLKSRKIKNRAVFCKMTANSQYIISLGHCHCKIIYIYTQHTTCSRLCASSMDLEVQQYDKLKSLGLYIQTLGTSHTHMTLKICGPRHL